MRETDKTEIDPNMQTSPGETRESSSMADDISSSSINIHQEAQMDSGTNEVDAFAAYAKRNIPKERQEAMKNFESERIMTPAMMTPARDDDEKTLISTKTEFARAALEKAEREDIISLLRRRSMHLPGNSWHKDWIQYIRNNHPLLGICLSHPLHPLRIDQRIYILVASVSFGLLATNLVYLYYMKSTEDFDEKVFRIYLQFQDGDFRPIEISHGMISLWLTNGVLHALFDVSLWHLSACSCFSSRKNFEKLQRIGSFAVVAISGAVAAASSVVIVGRALLSSGEEMEENDDELMQNFFVFEGYAFLIGYCVELCAVYFICYPLLVTIMFTGILGCFPFLGGRPKDVERYLYRLLDERSRIYGDLEIV